MTPILLWCLVFFNILGTVIVILSQIGSMNKKTVSPGMGVFVIIIRIFYMLSFVAIILTATQQLS